MVGKKMNTGSANQILNTRIQETMERKDITDDNEIMHEVWEALNSKSTDDEEEGKEDYNKVCNLFDLREGELVYYKGARSFPVIHDGFSYALGENSYSKDILKPLFQTKNKYERFMKYLLKHYHLKTKPVLRKLAYIVNPCNNDEGFVLRTDLQPHYANFKDWTNRASLVSTALDKTTSSYLAYVPTIEIKKSNTSLMNEMLNIMFGDNDIDIKRFIGVYTFENRYEISRPTLILYGDRGTGKSTFTEGLLAKIYQGMSSQMSTTDGFNDFLDNKLAFLDEVTEQRYDTSFMYDFLKQLSGQGRVLINTKNMKKFQIKNGVYVCVSSNEVKPLHIKDEITSERNNQFLTLKLHRTQASEERMDRFEIKIKKLGYYTTNDFIEDNLGDYLYGEIFDVYKAMRKAIKGKSYRYGMPIPITDGLRQLLGMSVSENDMASMRIIESLYFRNKKMYSEKMQETNGELFDFFSSGIPEMNLKGFLAFQVLREMLGIERIKVSAFKRFVTSNGFVVSGKLRVQAFGFRHDYSSVEGLVLDLDVISKYIDSQVQKSHVEMAEKFSEMRHQEVIEQEKLAFSRSVEPKSDLKPSVIENQNIDEDEEEMTLLDKLL